jgi:hypothetical protein
MTMMMEAILMIIRVHQMDQKQAKGEMQEKRGRIAMEKNIL